MYKMSIKAHTISHFYDLKITFGYTGEIPEKNIDMKYEYFEDENHIFGQAIWLLHTFL